MGYKAFIEVGSKNKKNYASTGSIEFKTKEELSAYVKRNPLGNYRTQVSVTDTKLGKVLKGNKLHFSNPRFW